MGCSLYVSVGESNLNERSPAHIDSLTIISIAVIAYTVANVTHELIGHCGMALVMGTRCTVLSSTYIPLASFPPTWKYNIIVVAGSAANFVLGIVCLLLLRRHKSEVRDQKSEIRGQRSEVREQRSEIRGQRSEVGEPRSEVGEQRSEVGEQRSEVGGQKSEVRGQRSEVREQKSGSLRAMLWLLMCVNLFLAATYVAVAPIIKFGDSYILIQNLPGQIFWRPAVALAGAIALWFSVRVARIELSRLIGLSGSARRALAWKLVILSYLTGGVLTVASAAFSRLDAKIAQLEAAGGTFGLTVWLLLLPLILPKREGNEEAPLMIPRGIGWIAAGAVTALIFVGVLGRGIAVN